MKKAPGNPGAFFVAAFGRMVAMTLPRAVLPLLLLLLATSAAAEGWPELSRLPLGASGGGEKDAAVIVGLEDYAAVAPIPGARRNADDWHAHLTGALKVPLERVALLRDNEAARESIEEKVREAAAAVEPGGTLWFVFIGHGAPSKDGKDGLLVGWDAQQRADSLFARSVSQKAVLAAMSKGRQERAMLLIDACFSGRTSEGAPLVPGLQPLILKTDTAAAGLAGSRAVVMTAARSDQFAGPLPGANRPAFSYLALGGLRGWAAGQGPLSPEALVAYAAKAMRALRLQQQPELTSFAPGQTLPSAREAGPDLASLVRAAPSAPAQNPFQFSNLQALPKPRAPGKLAAASTAVDMAGVDVDALARYDAALKKDKSDASPESKAGSWRELAKSVPAYEAMAQRRAKEWDEFAAQSDALEEAREARLPARDADWAKLEKLLGLEVVKSADKARWAGQFVSAYLDSPGLSPGMAKTLAPHLSPASAKSLKGRVFRDDGPAPWTYSSREDRFSLTLPSSWKQQRGSAGDEDYASRLFEDGSRRLLVLRHRQYRPRQTGSGYLFMTNGHGDYIAQLATGRFVSAEILKPHAVEAVDGREFATLTRRVSGVTSSGCAYTDEQLCASGVQRLAAMYHDGHVYLLAAIYPESSPVKEREWKGFLRSLKALD